jgi:hypothetical protein
MRVKRKTKLTIDFDVIWERIQFRLTHKEILRRFRLYTN